MAKIELRRTIVSESRVDYEYDYPESWHPFLVDPQDHLYIEYDFPLAQMPESILNIPFVLNMLMFCMFDGTELYIDRLDKVFYDAVPDILNGYRRLYGDRIKDVKIYCEHLENNAYELSGKNVVAFTGGVDATSAVASHINEKLVLSNIWGGDVRLNNPGRQQAHVAYFHELAEKYGYDVAVSKSNFRFLYDPKNIPYKFDHFWWSAFGHSIAIIGVLVPIAYYKKAQYIYMGSAYEITEQEAKHIPACNYAPIINSIRFASGSGGQCDTYLKRSQKINNIASAFKVNEHNRIKVLACWNQKAQIGVGGNCCHCEKCARTIMDIIVHGKDPVHFGFEVEPKTFSFIKDYVFSGRKMPVEMWKDIQSDFMKDREKWEKDKRVNWIFKVEIGKKRSLFSRVRLKIRNIMYLAADFKNKSAH